MWRTGVVLLAAIFFQVTYADVKYGVNDDVAQRLKRSPQGRENCNYYPPPPPPPPPPAFWPPPPPPPPPQYWPPPPPPQNQPARYQTYSADTASASEAPDASGPCSSCNNNGNGQNRAYSNAETDSGQAIAIAVAKARTNN